MVDPIHQFQVNVLVPIHILGLDLSITNSSLWMLIATLLICIIVTFVRFNYVPSRMQWVIEQVYQAVIGIVKDNAGPEAVIFFPYVLSLFLFVLMGNLLGIIPFSFTFTSQIVVTCGLSLTVFISTLIIGFYSHGAGFLRTFLPKGTPFYIAPLLVPIEIISFLSRPFSLGIRLFANMVAGHAMMKIFASFVLILLGMWGGVLSVFPFAISFLLIPFEILVAVLQAYVFTVLTCIYLNDALHLH